MNRVRKLQSCRPNEPGSNGTEHQPEATEAHLGVLQHGSLHLHQGRCGVLDEGGGDAGTELRLDVGDESVHLLFVVSFVKLGSGGAGAGVLARQETGCVGSPLAGRGCHVRKLWHKQQQHQERTWRSAIVRESPTQKVEGEAAILVTSTSRRVLICVGRIQHRAACKQKKKRQRQWVQCGFRLTRSTPLLDSLLAINRQEHAYPITLTL